MSPTSIGRDHYEMMGGVSLPVCLSVRLFVCRVLDLTRERKGLWKPAIGRTEAHYTYLEVERSKVKVIRQINAVRDNA